jgi:hypothetical protein
LLRIVGLSVLNGVLRKPGWRVTLYVSVSVRVDEFLGEPRAMPESLGANETQKPITHDNELSKG